MRYLTLVLINALLFTCSTPSQAPLKEDNVPAAGVSTTTADQLPPETVYAQTKERIAESSSVAQVETDSTPVPYQLPAGSAHVPKSPTPPVDPAEYPGTVPPNTTLEATPTAYEHVTTTPADALSPQFADALTGLWMNTIDSNEVVEFTPTHYTTFYEGELLLSEPMTVHERCPGDCTGGLLTDHGCFTITGPAGIDCIGIIRLNATELELKVLGVSPQTVTYQRR